MLHIFGIKGRHALNSPVRVLVSRSLNSTLFKPFVGVVYPKITKFYLVVFISTPHAHMQSQQKKTIQYSEGSQEMTPQECRTPTFFQHRCFLSDLLPWNLFPLPPFFHYFSGCLEFFSGRSKLYISDNIYYNFFVQIL